ncbi:MAG: hypothetical protein M5U29_00470 [Anaerolineae bacterium]|nr:hypothetical protein [Anaerolineae bacterium]
MDSFTRSNLIDLIDVEGEWCVSLYMPTVRTGTEVQQNTIRFRNLLRQAEERLARLQVRVPDAERLLAPAVAMLDDADLWRQQSDGLAVFAAPDHFSYYRLPVSFEERVTAKRRFHVKPLLPLFSGDGRFLVLALSQDQVRLLEGKRDSVTEIDLPGVPTSMAEALQYDQPQRQVRARAAGSTGGTVFHGHGGPEVTAKPDLLRYFHAVDRGLRDLIADRQVPLVLAGVDYLLPIYREANTYPHLVAQGVTGNPDTLNARELHQRAWAVVMPFFAKAQSEQVALYYELDGRDDPRASHTLKDVVRAAHEGRVATLFAPRGVQKWGVYRAHSQKVHVHPSEQPGDHDLIDLAAARTVANGGTVYVVDPAQMPGGDLVAAIFRY